ncbi:MAG: hypothetical protein ACI9YH_004640 [Colwellia sp.]|jgi:hypothetical protein
MKSKHKVEVIHSRPPINDLNLKNLNQAKTTIEELKSPLYTRKECKEIFKVSYVTLFNWKKKKILIPLTVGGKVYYRKEDIQRLLFPVEVSRTNLL